MFSPKVISTSDLLIDYRFSFSKGRKIMSSPKKDSWVGVGGSVAVEELYPPGGSMGIES